MLYRGIREKTTHVCIFHWVRWFERSNSMDLSFMAAQVRRFSSCLSEDVWLVWTFCSVCLLISWAWPVNKFISIIFEYIWTLIIQKIIRCFSLTGNHNIAKRTNRVVVWYVSSIYSMVTLVLMQLSFQTSELMHDFDMRWMTDKKNTTSTYYISFLFYF